MSTTTVEQTTTQENVKDSKSSKSVSETSQSTETKKKPGPKPKVKVEDTTSKEATSIEVRSENAVHTKSEKHEPESREECSEQTDKVKTLEESITPIDSEYVTAHILQRCPIYRTPSVKGVVLVMISGFVFANRTCIDGFYKVKYNSFERGAKTGYVESKYIAFGAKK